MLRAGADSVNVPGDESSGPPFPGSFHGKFDGKFHGKFDRFRWKLIAKILGILDPPP